MPTIELPTPTPLPDEADNTQVRAISKRKKQNRTVWQFLRFGLVGCLNTAIDLLVLNCLLLLWPTQDIARLLLFNTIAYTFGALNSFLLNKYWTFRRSGRPNAREVARFILITLVALACNDLILWFASKILQSAHLNLALWTNISKVVAIGGTILISYLGMRLWVFVQMAPERQRVLRAFFQRGEKSFPPGVRATGLCQKLALGTVMLISLFVNFYQLGQNGFGNLFYAAGVRSMTDNLHNFFFASYDPGGFVTIDKPPLGFWLQAISVKIFGFTPFSIFLPQALAGVLAVLVLFHLARRHFGVTAGLLAAQQIYFIASNPAWGTWLIPLIAVPCPLVALVLIAARPLSRLEIDPRVILPALSFGTATLLLTPAVWSAIPAVQNLAISTPSAGPSRRFDFGHFAGDNSTTNASLISYLEANQEDAKYLVATPNSMSADSIILATNKPVMALGGFAGADPILTTSQLVSLVTNRTVRFFLLNNPSRLPQIDRRMLSGFGTVATQSRAPGFFGFGRNSQSTLTTWVKKHCAAVPASKWQSPAASTGRGESASALLLYDCVGVK